MEQQHNSKYIARLLTTEKVLFALNETYAKTPSEEKRAYLLYNVLILLFGVIIVLTNVTVVISCCIALKKGHNPKHPYLILGNVGIAQTITGISVILGQAIPDNLKNYQICSVQIGLIVSSTVVSIYLIGYLAVNRFIYLLYGCQSQQSASHLIKTQALLLLIWILGSIIGYSPLIYRPINDSSNNGQTCWFVLIFSQSLIKIILAVSMIPPSLTLILYSTIIHKLLGLLNVTERENHPKTSSKREKNNTKLLLYTNNNNTNNKNNNASPKTQQGFLERITNKKFHPNVTNTKRWKTLKLVFFTTFSFTLTWSPYVGLSLYYVIVCGETTTKRCRSFSLVIASPLALLGFVSCFLNPIIYVWWHKGFNGMVKRRASTVKLKFAQNGKVAPKKDINVTKL